MKSTTCFPYGLVLLHYAVPPCVSLLSNSLFTSLSHCLHVEYVYSFASIHCRCSLIHLQAQVGVLEQILVRILSKSWSKSWPRMSHYHRQELLKLEEDGVCVAVVVVKAQIEVEERYVISLL